jgi:hypothetical protein
VSAGAAPSACNCTPSYYGVVWDGAACKTRKTRRFKRVMEARNTRKDLAASLSEGRPLPSVAGPHLGEVRGQFIRAARDGVALNSGVVATGGAPGRTWSLRSSAYRTSSCAGGWVTFRGVTFSAWWTR